MSDLTLETRTGTDLTLEDRAEDITWDEATMTWDENTQQWGNPAKMLTLESRTGSDLTLETR